MDFEGFKETVLTVFPELTAEQWDRFAALDALYRDWNAKINVISRKDIDGLYLHHVLHSLAIAAYLKTEKPDEYAALPGRKEAAVLPAGCPLRPDHLNRLCFLPEWRSG